MNLTPFSAPKLWRWQMPWLTWNLPEAKDEVYLTFDDGPIPEVTPWVKETLEHYGALGTFFMIGENVRKHPDLFRSILYSDHAIGNHTQHHRPLNSVTQKEYLEDTAECQQTMSQLGAERVRLFRPPHGRINQSTAKELIADYRVVMWDFLTQDYRADLDIDRVKNKARKMIRPGSVVVLHDSLKAEKQLRKLLPFFLELISEQRWKAAAIPADQGVNVS